MWLEKQICIHTETKFQSTMYPSYDTAAGQIVKQSTDPAAGSQKGRQQDDRKLFTENTRRDHEQDQKSRFHSMV